MLHVSFTFESPTSAPSRLFQTAVSSPMNQSDDHAVNTEKKFSESADRRGVGAVDQTAGGARDGRELTEHLR
jgi:hypothetical protein